MRHSPISGFPAASRRLTTVGLQASIVLFVCQAHSQTLRLSSIPDRYGRVSVALRSAVLLECDRWITHSVLSKDIPGRLHPWGSTSS